MGGAPTHGRRVAPYPIAREAFRPDARLVGPPVRREAAPLPRLGRGEGTANAITHSFWFCAEGRPQEARRSAGAWIISTKLPEWDAISLSIANTDETDEEVAAAELVSNG